MRCPECKGEIIESRIVDERRVPVKIFLNCKECQWEDEVLCNFESYEEN